MRDPVTGTIVDAASKAQNTAKAPWLVFILQDGLVDHYSPRSACCSANGIGVYRMGRLGQQMNNARQRGLNATVLLPLGVTSASAPSRHQI